MWGEFRGLTSQIAKIAKISKSPKDSEDYKAFLYAQEARVKANLKRLVPIILLSIVFSTYIFVLRFHQYSIGSQHSNMFIGLFAVELATLVLYTVFIAKLMNKPKVDIKKGKLTYLSFWIIFEIWVCFIAILQYKTYGHLQPWFVFFVLSIVVPVFNITETVSMLVLAGILVQCVISVMEIDNFKYFVAGVPFFIMIALVFQSIYFSRMKILIAQSRIEQRGYIAEKRMQGIFDDLFEEVYQINLNKNEFTLIRSKGSFKSSHMKDSYEKSIDNIAKTILHPDDAENFAKKFSIDNVKNEFREGKGQIYHESRRLKVNGEYAWTSILMIREYTENKEEFKLMQLLQDIDDRKTSEVRLKNAAQTDPLTKLYNKTTTQKMIDKYLEGEGAGGSHAFIIIDLDEFKSINDTHGHFAGDDVLIQLSKELRSYFRESDILGRIGGDEFVAFIKNVQSVALVCDKVQRLSASFKKYGLDNNYNYKLSVSMGIAMHNKDGKTYDELYKNADKALYEAKRNGKDQYKFCIKNVSSLNLK
ncbi:MAG: GGDEF domain-containing protein [Acutalibacteraceae bacterium]